MTWALLSLIGSRLKAHLLITRKRSVVLPCALQGRDGSAISFPLPVYTADANGGLCIGRRCVDVLGAWGPSVTNKQCLAVYTEQLLLPLSTPDNEG